MTKYIITLNNDAFDDDEDVKSIEQVADDMTELLKSGYFHIETVKEVEKGKGDPARGWFSDKDDETIDGYPWQPCFDTKTGHIPCFEVFFKTKEECDDWIRENVIGAGWEGSDR